MSTRFFTKILLALGFLACTATAAYAVKAYPYPIKVTQPDGTTITIQVHGDEFLNWTTAGNRLVEKGPDGFYYYASFNSDGTKSISKSRATSTTLASFTASVSGNTVRPPQAAIAAAKAKRSTARIGNSDLAKGKHKFLVMLVEFSDLEFTVDNPKDAFHDLLNKKGYSENGGTGSSYDYYSENSNGEFDPTFDVVGPFKVNRNHAAYGDDKGDQMAAVLLAEACKVADPDINFADYDQDGNGVVDNIFFYYAGHNAAEGAGGDCIWPHKWELYEHVVGKLTMDGVNLNTSYACTSEYSGHMGSNMAGIGTFTHEFGHVIGLPDFYDTNTEEGAPEAPGPGTLSLMCSGSYNNQGRTPPYLGGLERALLGWLDLTEWKESGIKTLNPIHDNEAYMTPTKNKTPEDGALNGEYYVYEYRDGTGWDSHIGATGVAIYHVDRRQAYLNAWDVTNEVNDDPKHECYDLIESSGNPNALDNLGKLYPGSSNNREFSSNSNPASVDWEGNTTGFNITEITDNARNATLMLVNLSGGTIIEEFKDAGVNAIDREASYSAGDQFAFKMTVSNYSPIEVVWFFDGTEQSSDTSSVELTAGEHTVQAVLTYSDGSKETITTKLNVQ